MRRILSVHGDSGPRARLDLPLADVRRIAQAVANTEGRQVAIIGGGTIETIDGDENEHPHLTLEERVWVVTTDVLKEMLADATNRTADAARDYQTILDEVTRRLS